MRLLHFLLLNRPRLISVFGLLMLSLLIWFAGAVVASGAYAGLTGRPARLIAIAMLLLVALLLAYTAWRRGRANNIHLIDGLFGDSGSAAANADGVLALSREAAFEYLCPSGHQPRPFPAPWYFVVGDAGVGKSSLIRNSKLLPNHYSGSGVTSKFDWWINNRDAPMLEMALPTMASAPMVLADSHSVNIPDVGAQALRRVVEEADWQQLLSRMQRYRQAPALNGVLLVLSLADLGGLNRQGLHDCAVAWRARLADLQARLNARVPCYLVLTHADSLEGFGDCFACFSPEGREQVWGVTFRAPRRWLSVDAQRPTKHDQQHQLRRLQHTVTNLCWHRLAAVPAAAARYRVFEFPQRFARSCDRLQIFLEGLLDKKPDEAGVFLRGLYFSSVIPASDNAAAQSFFVDGIFNRVVLAEPGLARSTALWDRITGPLKLVFWPLLTVVVFAVLAYWGSGLLSLRQETVAIKQALQQFSHWSEGVERGAQASLPDMARALNLLRSAKLKDPQRQLLRHQHKRMQEALKRAYRRALQRYLWPAVLAQMESQLSAGWTAPQSLRETLSLYQSLGTEGPLPVDRLRRWLRLNLADAGTVASDARDSGGLVNHIDALLATTHVPQPSNDAVVQRAIQRLADHDAGRRDDR